MIGKIFKTGGGGGSVEIPINEKKLYQNIIKIDGIPGNSAVKLTLSFLSNVEINDYESFRSELKSRYDVGGDVNTICLLYGSRVEGNSNFEVIDIYVYKQNAPHAARITYKNTYSSAQWEAFLTDVDNPGDITNWSFSNTRLTSGISEDV